VGRQAREHNDTLALCCKMYAKSYSKWDEKTIMKG